ncbi:MAG: GrpB family protein [Oligoflexales bacterium]|nr:GrpB family protein [Oligoflexales bacterium]
MSRPEKIVNEIVAKMQECGLGMRRKTVELSGHNNLWATAFLWLKDKIKGRLGDSCIYRVEHFGSTSIPGIAAKPALDVMLIFNSLSDLQPAIRSFEELGFIYKGDAVGKLNQAALEPDRHFFSFYDLGESIDYIHLHVFVDGHPDVKRNLGFRDILRKNISLAEEYAQIKHQLKDQGLSRQDYTRTKSAFISRVVSDHGK